jgi:hypothetical protein
MGTGHFSSQQGSERQPRCAAVAFVRLWRILRIAMTIGEQPLFNDTRHRISGGAQRKSFSGS